LLLVAQAIGSTGFTISDFTLFVPESLSDAILGIAGL
jgi:hypothetical protein